MKTKLSGKFWAALTLFSLMGQVAWVVENMYLNVFIYKMFNASADDISLMVSASAISATLTTVIMGALSDKISKRKLFICGGYIAWGISILGFALLKMDVIEAVFPAAISAASVGVSLVIIMDCVMTFFGSTANDAAFNAWLTDSTDSSNRGSAEGINAMMPLVAILVVFGGFMFFDLNLASSWTLIFLIIGIAVLIIGFSGLFLIKEPAVQRSESGYFKNIIYGFMPSTIKANPRFYLTLIAFAVFNISIQIFMPYLILYYEVSLGMTDYVLVMAPAIIVASIVTALWGKVYDKKGFNFSVIFSVVWLSLGYTLLYFFKDRALVFIGSLLMMCGYLAGMAVFGALIRDCTPQGKSGMIQGVRIFSQVLLPGIIGPYIGAAVLANAEKVTNSDGTTSFIPNENIFAAALVPIAVLVILLIVIFKSKKPTLISLKTPFEDNLGDTPWEEYPRPALKRDSYFCLNGQWDFWVANRKGETKLGKILVPFAPQSRLSGIEKTFKKNDILVYRRSFTLPKGFVEDRVILNFGASDQITTVYINNKLAGENVGGYIPFSFDITSLIGSGENKIEVLVKDTLDPNIPYGKQRKKRGGMWYTEISGIWQTVWLESVPENYIKSVKITPNLSGAEITVDAKGPKQLVFEGETYTFDGDSYSLKLDNPINWSPENPHLYNFTLICGEDKVDSYFAARTIGIKDGKFMLNDKPYFFHGLLDQGYFSDGIYLPATPDGFKYDILKMKELGFNMLRKHIKIEPQLFYYYCDKYGMAVFQDLVNSGRYSFLIDTALPTLFLKKGVTHFASKKRREIFEKTAEQTLELLYNHPSICYYTLFNEGWGQYDTARVYKKIKALDTTRIWDAASGWFFYEDNEVISEHVYFKPIKTKSDGTKPAVISEFGGYSYKLDDHSFNLSNTYGYRYFTEREAFEQAITKLYLDEVVPAIKNGVCASVITQVSDVEDETNGFLTYDRQVVKVDTEPMQSIASKLFNTFNENA